MILFARRPSYRPKALKTLLERDRHLFEHWTHDASVLPVSLFPYWQHRFARDADRLRENWRRWFREGYEARFDSILDRIARDGPVTSAEVARARRGARAGGGTGIRRRPRWSGSGAPGSCRSRGARASTRSMT